MQGRFHAAGPLRPSVPVLVWPRVSGLCCFEDERETRNDLKFVLAVWGERWEGQISETTANLERSVRLCLDQQQASRLSRAKQEDGRRGSRALEEDRTCSLSSSNPELGPGRKEAEPVWALRLMCGRRPGAGEILQIRHG
jgi:hypothetical protein